jgi:DNA-binding response OmpR family regulator
MGKPSDDAGTAQRVGRITIYPQRYEVYVDHQRIDLTLTQFRLLSALARRPGWVIRPDQFEQRYARPASRESAPAGQSVKHHIAALRRKLGTAAVQVQTVRGQGYRLAEAPPDAETSHKERGET